MFFIKLTAWISKYPSLLVCHTAFECLPIGYMKWSCCGEYSVTVSNNTTTHIHRHTHRHTHRVFITCGPLAEAWGTQRFACPTGCMFRTFNVGQAVVVEAIFLHNIPCGLQLTNDRTGSQFPAKAPLGFCTCSTVHTHTHTHREQVVTVERHLNVNLPYWRWLFSTFGSTLCV